MCPLIEVFTINLSQILNRQLCIHTPSQVRKARPHLQKYALSAESDLIWMLKIKQQHYEVISAKQMLWYFRNFPGLYFSFSLLEMLVILWTHNTTMLKTCKLYLASIKITVCLNSLLLPLCQSIKIHFIFKCHHAGWCETQIIIVGPLF